MLNRWVWFLLLAVFGLVMLAYGLLVPAHLKAVDAGVIDKAGRNSATLTDRGLELVDEQNLGAAYLVLQAAQIKGMSGQDQLGAATDALASKQPLLLRWGLANPRLLALLDGEVAQPNRQSEPFVDFIIQRVHREKALDFLSGSPSPAVQELLRFRTITNTVVFSPSQSASGQALDAAISMCGLLLEGGHLTTGFSNSVLVVASEANGRGNSQSLEQVLLDLMSLGQRLNWGQLVSFVGNIEDASTLRKLTAFVQRGYSLPLLYSAVELSGKPADVANYLTKFSQTGLRDLGESLRYGEGGVNELLRRDQQLYASNLSGSWAAHGPLGGFYNFALDYGWRKPRIALITKWLLYLCGGFLLAVAAHFAKPGPSVLERPLRVHGFHLAREFLFALGFLFVVLLLSEPFLAQDNQKVEIPFRLRLPMVGDASQTGNPSVETSFMNHQNLNLLIVLLFFVLQGLLYTACLVKLAEIRRQRVPPRIKLRLLENEDHLFDGGLYLGFLGTIISFVVYSIWTNHQFVLWVAYSSTSFGIIFVSFFKICHLRPFRRKLLLEAEAKYPEPAATVGTPTLLTQP